VFAALFQALAKRPEERPTARAFADALSAASGRSALVQ